MKIDETRNTKMAEESFAASVAVVLLLILPMWGGVAMVVGAAIGLLAYAVLFRERLRRRGWLRALVIPVTAAAVLGAVLAVLLTWGHWR